MRARKSLPVAVAPPARLQDLTPRQRQVLEALVRQYLRTAHPVSSERLAPECAGSWSPATLRHAMLDLDSLGLLEQPHPSAGRVPSDRGYRLFVNALREPQPLSDEESRAVEAVLADSVRDVEHLLGQASRLLAERSEQLGFAVAPRLEEGQLAGLDLVSVGERRLLLVLTVRSGVVRSTVLQLTSPLSRSELERVARILRERLLGQSLADVRRRLAEDGRLVHDSAVALVAGAAAEVLGRTSPPEVYVGGTARVARLPEFREAERLRPILELVDGTEPWCALVGHAARPGLTITIGRENNRPELAHLSFVSFQLDGPVRASVGLLGPTRMDYGRAMALVEFVGRRLSAML